MSDCEEAILETEHFEGKKWIKKGEAPFRNCAVKGKEARGKNIGGLVQF